MRARQDSNPAAFCLEAMQYKALSAAAGVAYEEARHLARLELDRRWTEIHPVSRRFIFFRSSPHEGGKRNVSFYKVVKIARALQVNPSKPVDAIR
jgi:hypothetical protein